MTTALRLRWLGFLTASLFVHALALAWVEVSAPSRGRLPSTLSVLLESPGQEAAAAKEAVKPQRLPPSVYRSRDRSGRSRPSSSTPRLAVAPPAPAKEPRNLPARAKRLATVKVDSAPKKQTAMPRPVAAQATLEPSQAVKTVPQSDDSPEDSTIVAATAEKSRHRFPDPRGMPTRNSRKSVSTPVRSAGLPRQHASSASRTGAAEARRFELLALLHDAISREQRYPLLARRQRREGTATVSFKLSPSGNMDGINIDRSSGFRMLDTAALGAVSRVAPFGPARSFLIETTRFKVNVKFRLN